MVDIINREGGRHLENVDRDLVFLRKEFKRAVKRSKKAVIRLMADLEVKVEKLALKVVKMEVAINPGSSSRFDKENT